MTGKRADSPANREIKRNLNGRILRNTMLNIVILVVICCVIMALSLQSLANSILLDSLQPMARQSAKTVEANIHMLADRMMTIAGDYRMKTVFTVPEKIETELPEEPEEVLPEETGEALPGEGEETGEVLPEEPAAPEEPVPEEPVPEEAAEPVPDLAATEENRKTVLEEAAEIYELYNIALYDLEGKLVQGNDGAPERLEEDLLALLQETDNLTTDPDTIYEGKLGIKMGMPVKENGETILYLMGVYKYDTLNDVISSINLGRTGRAYMVNREGVVTGHPDQSLALGGSTLVQLSDGNAGAVLVLCRQSRDTGDEAYLKGAQNALSYLEDRRLESGQGVTWIEKAEGSPVCSLAHGNSGMLLAYARMESLVHNGLWGKRMRQIMAYEDQYYREEYGNWADLRREKGQWETYAWCNGGMGVVYARLLAKKWNPEELADVDIGGRSEVLARKLAVRGDMCLCHGNMGNLLILREMMRGLGERENLMRQIGRLEDALESFVRDLDEEKGRVDFGFMNGMAGVGFGCFERNAHR